MKIKLLNLLQEIIDIYSPEELNSKEIEYGAEGKIRNQLYNYYIIKHFPDFNNSQEKIGNETLQVWKKI